jgi:hypothetical protein
MTDFNEAPAISLEVVAGDFAAEHSGPFRSPRITASITPDCYQPTAGYISLVGGTGD